MIKMAKFLNFHLLILLHLCMAGDLTFHANLAGWHDYADTNYWLRDPNGQDTALTNAFAMASTTDGKLGT